MSKLFQQFINPLFLSIFAIIIIIHRSSSNEFELPTVEMIKGHGYESAQSYKFKTSDGYTLELHRIPKSRLGKIPYKNHPVLIPNIYVGSSADWVVGGPEKSLPEQLADYGYDVWLGNYRGNTYCREHDKYTTNEYEFWDFSLHEFGTIDLPEMIDFILTETKKQKLHFIGFSMSATTFFIMASEKPEYQDKIRTNIMMAPVANIRHTKSSFLYFSAVSKSIHALFRVINHGEFLPYQKKVGTFLRKLCKMNYLKNLICLRLVLWSACGKDPYFFDEELIPQIFGHYPAGTSSKVFKHYAQSIMTDGFYQYDYGPRKNLLEYGSEYPPSYYLKNFTAPSIIFYADNDLLANPQDTEDLMQELGTAVLEKHKVNNRYFNHADFIFGLKATELVYTPIKGILQRHDILVDEM